MPPSVCPGVAGVTGGASGIGAAYVDALLGRGFKVAILDIFGAAEAAASRPLFASAVVGIACDVSNAARFRFAFDEALTHFGATHFTCFVCNAGVVAPLFADAERQVAVNLVGAIRGVEMAVKAATGAFAHPAEPALCVVVTASSNGLIPADSDLAPVYVETKFALVGLVRSLRPLAARFNVRVNAVAPVTVETPMVAGLLPPEVRAFLQEEGRGGVLPPAACADALLRILDDSALAGEVVAVHPDAGAGGRVIAADPGGQLAFLGAWSEGGSPAVAALVDEGFAAVASGTLQAWSGV